MLPNFFKTLRVRWTKNGWKALPMATNLKLYFDHQNNIASVTGMIMCIHLQYLLFQFVLLFKAIDIYSTKKIDQVSISPTFKEQLLRPYFCAKKTTNLKCKSKKVAHKIFVWKDAHKILVKLTIGLLENSFPSLRSRFGLSQQVSPLQ